MITLFTYIERIEILKKLIKFIEYRCKQDEQHEEILNLLETIKNEYEILIRDNERKEKDLKEKEEFQKKKDEIKEIVLEILKEISIDKIKQPKTIL